jgi:hypothetical protein
MGELLRIPIIELFLLLFERVGPDHPLLLLLGVLVFLGILGFFGWLMSNDI